MFACFIRIRVSISCDIRPFCSGICVNVFIKTVWAFESFSRISIAIVFTLSTIFCYISRDFMFSLVCTCTRAISEVI